MNLRGSPIPAPIGIAIIINSDYLLMTVYQCASLLLLPALLAMAGVTLNPW